MRRSKKLPSGKSSYFPEPSDGLEAVDVAKQYIPKQADSASTSNQILFPTSRAVLWDRSPEAHPYFLNSVDILPLLFLSSDSINALLKKNDLSVDSKALVTEQRAIVISITGLEDHNKILNQPIMALLGSPNFVLMLRDVPDQDPQTCTRFSSLLNFKNCKTIEMLLLLFPVWIVFAMSPFQSSWKILQVQRSIPTPQGAAIFDIQICVAALFLSPSRSLSSCTLN